MRLGNWILALAILPVWSSAYAANDCVVKEWSLARDVNDMKPVGIAQSFSSSDVSQVFVFASLDCNAIDGAVVVKFDRDGKIVHEKQITIQPANNYRLWTSVAAYPGKYRVTLEIRGALLNSDDFEVLP
jgi:hypothetical protein